MALQYLLDTHVVIRWMSEPARLSKEQARVLHQSLGRGEAIAVSALSILEIAMWERSSRKTMGSVENLLVEIETNPVFHVLPITVPIALDAAALIELRDSADRTIVATARIHRLRLLTSDQRIIESRLVAVVD